MSIELAPGVYTVGEGKPAVFVAPLRAVVLADLHLGFEEEAASQGYYVPRIQLRRSLEILRSVLDETGADWVIFAGDVKHCFSRLLWSERRELEELFSFLEKRGVRVTVVRGNHDNYLPIVAKKHGVEIVQELYVDGYLVIHGHKKPAGGYPGPVKAVIMGHEHPSIRLRDRLGYVTKMPCFLTAPYRPLSATLVVLPAIGQYQTGTSVTLDPSTYLSPLLREEVDLSRVKPYVLAEDFGVFEFPELGLLEDLLAEITL
ncbi:MAG: metallophosphoesterase [Crenarchaeota archaeon]|nr:metallophosphoesterase [Thermoproteota archaeon]